MVLPVVTDDRRSCLLSAEAIFSCCHDIRGSSSSMIVAEVLQNLSEEKIQAKPRCCSVESGPSEMQD
jgi:hypothetical protein